MSDHDVPFPFHVVGEQTEEFHDVYVEALHAQRTAMDAEIDDVMKSIWLPIINEQLRMPMHIIGDGWPRRFVLFPRLDRLGYQWRWAKRDLHEWWDARPPWLGGDGLPEEQW